MISVNRTLKMLKRPSSNINEDAIRHMDNLANSNTFFSLMERYQTVLKIPKLEVEEAMNYSRLV